MKNEVNVYFNISAIQVDGEQFIISGVSLSLIIDKLPSDVDFSGVKSLSWSENTGLPKKGVIPLSDGSPFMFGEEKYNDYIQPYVDIWQTEKDRLEQEQQQAHEEFAKFENRKERALTAITDDYHNALEKAFVRTSLGFDADINPDSVATLLGTQTSLAYTTRTLAEDAEPPKTVFRDFYGLKRELDVVQVELLICQINAAQNHIRELKYEFKDQIKNTGDNDGLNAVIEGCNYSTLDFTQLDEAGKPAVLPFVSAASIKERIDRF